MHTGILLFFVLILIKLFPHFTANNCVQLSAQSLAKIHGQAFNPRYMSIDPPNENQGSNKRSSSEIPFYAENDVVSTGDFPAWETNHVNFYEERRKSVTKQKRYLRNEHSYSDRSFRKVDVFKTRPWECTSKLAWMDLGLNYFPRYIRSVECVSKKCWYGNFNCKPKSFTIKVLKKKSGSCIKISEKLQMVTSENFESDYTELWVWEEFSINFCCECELQDLWKM